ncbi:asparaginase [Auritidibacter ignavus]|uniref:asparaginase n=1 Tax=Auritidibacter TaxID=1160973 RepID=UPI001304A669|nr:MULTISPECIES: asparaginase [Auritidibacter]WGH81361.1 asparaginase [Auritidibacter ignavus]WGH90569.1 asparaginase [Auritidibacter ignavus]WHS28704.1 asparaginase [Auritidibacter ignavus]
MPRVHVIATGGTIASRTEHHSIGSVASDSVEELLGVITSGDREAHEDWPEHQVSGEQLFSVNSFRLTFADLRQIALAVEQAVADPEVVGVVITHGTDTIEDTAFFLHCVYTGTVPVVITGAQKPADDPAGDGPGNLREAILAAGHPHMADTGVTISFAGRIHSARATRKHHTLAPEPFTGGTEIATVTHGKLVRQATAAAGPGLPMPTAEIGSVQIPILEAGLGSSAQLARHLVEDSASCGITLDGLVLMGTGAGNAADGFVTVVDLACQHHIPVVLATRTTFGPVVAIYGNGGGVDLVAAGAMLAGSLSPYQARILLALLVCAGFAADQLANRFAEVAG